MTAKTSQQTAYWLTPKGWDETSGPPTRCPHSSAYCCTLCSRQHEQVAGGASS